MKKTKFDIIRKRISEGKSVSNQSIEEAIKEDLQDRFAILGVDGK